MNSEGFPPNAQIYEVNIAFSVGCPFGPLIKRIEFAHLTDFNFSLSGQPIKHRILPYTEQVDCSSDRIMTVVPKNCHLKLEVINHWRLSSSFIFKKLHFGSMNIRYVELLARSAFYSFRSVELSARWATEKNSKFKIFYSLQQ